MQSKIVDYFAGTASTEKTAQAQSENNTKAVALLTCDIKVFLAHHRDHNWTGRQVARIFHGISSPQVRIFVKHKINK